MKIIRVQLFSTGIADEANKVMDNISDIVSLPPLDLEEFSHAVKPLASVPTN